MGKGAVVDVVEEETSDQKFAHKIFRRCYGSGLGKFQQAFKNEIDIIKRLHSHPHIIQVCWSYTCGRDFGMLLTPVASDGDLRAYLHTIKDTGEPLTTEQSFVLGRSFGCLASGLAFIHSHTIRHKDIKPQNILVHEGQMIFTDFGIALDASGQDTTTTGTPEAYTKRYCAPEVADWEPRNRKSDVFSLGCVFMEIMAVLAPDVDMGVSDSRPYWQRIGNVQNNLTRLSTSTSGLDQLFPVFSSMLEPKSEHRIEAKVVLHQIRSIQRSRVVLAYELICKNCELLASGTPQNVTNEGAMIMSDMKVKTFDKENDDSDEENDDSDEENDEQSRGAPGSSFYGPQWTPYSKIESEIRAAAFKNLSEQEKRPGYMYICYRPDKLGEVRIGRTKNVPVQIARWEELCKHHLVEYDQQIGGERVLIQNVIRVERLVMAELRDFQLKERCTGCGKTHYQWFRTTPEHAAKIIKKYVL